MMVKEGWTRKEDFGREEVLTNKEERKSIREMKGEEIVSEREREGGYHLMWKKKTRGKRREWRDKR